MDGSFFAPMSLPKALENICARSILEQTAFAVWASKKHGYATILWYFRALMALGF